MALSGGETVSAEREHMHPNAPLALQHLSKFTFATRTNLVKGKLTNHDAAALIFYTCGQMTRREFIEIMNHWRFGKFETKPMTTYDACASKRTKRYEYKTVQVPVMGFSYLLEISDYGGYKFTAKDATTRGQENSWLRPWKENCKPGEEFGKGFRRNYWFRKSKNTYATTLECFKRVKELGF